MREFASAVGRTQKQFWRSRSIATAPELRIWLVVQRYFTPPAVRPATIRRWKINTAISNGTVTITPAAMMVPYGVSNPVVPVNLLIATVAVCLSADGRNVRASRNSFQDPMNTMIAVVETPGAASGRDTLRNATPGVQ